MLGRPIRAVLQRGRGDALRAGGAQRQHAGAGHAAGPRDRPGRRHLLQRPTANTDAGSTAPLPAVFHRLRCPAAPASQPLDLVDGRPFSSGTITVLLGNGNGTFHAPKPSKELRRPEPPPAWPSAIPNGDGRPDLAVANYNSSCHRQRPGSATGDGTFPPAFSLRTVGNNPCVHRRHRRPRRQERPRPGGVELGQRHMSACCSTRATASSTMPPSAATLPVRNPATRPDQCRPQWRRQAFRHRHVARTTMTAPSAFLAGQRRRHLRQAPR